MCLFLSEWFFQDWVFGPVVIGVLWEGWCVGSGRIAEG